MVETKLTSDGLAGLRSTEKLQLLDAVDSLRSHGISRYISLPQIIVCGDQSSGKSSVLEAISGVSFPVRSNVCTRFPTELILRKTAHTGVTVSIVPHHSRSKSERETLSSFRERLDSFNKLPDLIERAKDVMGISAGKAFSNDILHIEISGPDRDHLTIVDLPGLIHSETKNQSKADVKMVKEVVQGYMKQSRSVILAVVSAKNEVANQVVLKLSQRADPKGTRTLGVITKPDTLHPGSESEQNFIALAQNQDVELRLGWHVLKNRDSEKDSWESEERNGKETEFFSEGTWQGLSPADWGIESFVNKLSKLLLRQISSELPSFVSEVETKTALRQAQLEKLGQPRITIGQQRTYLIQTGQSFQAIVKAATEGTYTNPFFENATSVAGYQKRFRAVIQNLGIEFAEQISKEGRSLRICDENQDDVDREDSTVTKDEYIDKIVKLMRRSRGRELPGMFNPMIVADLFKEQALPWGGIARAHVKTVWVAARDFLRRTIEHVADSTTVGTVLKHILMPKLDEIFNGLSQRINVLLSQHQEGHPITYNHYFTDTLQKIRRERNKVELGKKILEAENILLSSNDRMFRDIDLEPLLEELADPLEPDMSRFAAREALDFLEAYYKVALKRFVDDVAVEVIEAGLVSELEKILDPVTVSLMSSDELAKVAGETEASRATRKELETELTVLKEGLGICKTFAGFGISDLDENAESLAKDHQDSGSDDLSDDEENGHDSGNEPIAEQVFSVSEEVPVAEIVNVEPYQPEAEAYYESEEEAYPEPEEEAYPEPVEDVPAPDGFKSLSKKEKKKLKSLELRKRAIADEQPETIEATAPQHYDDFSDWGGQRIRKDHQRF
ncbi:hypothetical protein FZEAL_2886 [Fusarium zealandicum]|uniref:Dynamin family protein n=1 Tax=Fusarium zealandicum TaxID=1053134 RepID=A0A8H4UPT6_9HYPO|nr:hypothetical protein FZEAL_2886 [Fusarium zealandicum]